MMRRLTFVPAGLALVLSACVGNQTGPVRSAGTAATRPAPPSTVRTPARRPLAAPPRQLLPGLEGVIGASGAELMRQFGPPRLDVLEGDVRKLQYSGDACVLDIYLYPPEAGREPVASYVDARRASDAQDVDRAACVAAMRRRGNR